TQLRSVPSDPADGEPADQRADHRHRFQGSLQHGSASERLAICQLLPRPSACAHSERGDRWSYLDPHAAASRSVAARHVRSTDRGAWHAGRPNRRPGKTEYRSRTHSARASEPSGPFGRRRRRISEWPETRRRRDGYFAAGRGRCLQSSLQHRPQHPARRRRQRQRRAVSNIFPVPRECSERARSASPRSRRAGLHGWRGRSVSELANSAAMSIRTRVRASWVIICLACTAVIRLSAQDRFVSPAQQRIGWAERTVQANPKEPQGHIDLALALARRARETGDASDYARATEALAPALAVDAKNFEANKVQVWIAVGQRDFARAR